MQPSHPAMPSEGCRETFAPPLIGKRILVIGDEGHAPGYRAILDRFGVTMDFLPGFDKDRQLASKLSRADGMVFITAYASHLKFYALKAEKAKDTCSLVH